MDCLEIDISDFEIPFHLSRKSTLHYEVPTRTFNIGARVNEHCVLFYLRLRILFTKIMKLFRKIYLLMLFLFVLYFCYTYSFLVKICETI